MHKVSRRQFFQGGAIGVAAGTLGSSVLSAQDWARQAVDRSPRKRQWVSVKSGSRSLESTVAFPQSQAKAPGMVIIHDIYGGSDWMEKVADEFAEAGIVAIAPDLLSGVAPNGGRTKDLAAAEIGPAIQKLPPDQITADLNACAEYVKSLPACNGKVCVVGFSWGGGQCFRFATNRKDLAAAFVFYGTGPAAPSMAAIQAPVYGFYGGEDARVNATIPATQEQMKAAGKSYESVIYDGAVHGFMKAGGQPDATEANAKARAAAWAKIKSLVGGFK